MLSPASATLCRVCGHALTARRVRSELTITVCTHCQTAWLAAEASAAEIEQRYQREDYFRFWGSDDWAATSRQKARSAAWLLRQLEAVRHGQRGTLLEVGCAGGELLAVAQQRGWQIRGVELSATMVARANQLLGGEYVIASSFACAAAQLPPHNCLVLNDVLEHFADPLGTLRLSHACLVPGGTLVINTPDWGSVSARLMGKYWTHYKGEHLVYFSKKSLSQALGQSRFRLLRLGNTWKVLSPGYIAEHLRVYGHGRLVKAIHRGVTALPPAVQHLPIPMLSGNLLAIAEAC